MLYWAESAWSTASPTKLPISSSDSAWIGACAVVVEMTVIAPKSRLRGWIRTDSCDRTPARAAASR